MAASKTSKKAAKADPTTPFYGICGKGARCERDEGRRQVIRRADFQSAKDGKFYHVECLPNGHDFVSPESLSPKAGKKRPVAKATKAPAKAKAKVGRKAATKKSKKAA